MKKLFALCACALFAIGLTACGSSTSGSGDADFASVQTSVKDAIVTYLEANGVTPAEENGQISGYNTLDITSDDTSLYPDIDPADFANGTIYMPLMMVKSDLIIVAEAKDADALKRIETSFDAIKAAQIEQWQQYLPDQFEKVENGKIITSGNFILYSTFDDESVIKAFEAATK